MATLAAQRKEALPVGRAVAVSLAGVVLVVVSWVNLTMVMGAGGLGVDYLYYAGIGQRFLDTGAYYCPHQLAGPYDITLMHDVLYPPSALVLFVPAAVLPAPLWWIVPIGVTVYVVAGWRPSAWGVAGMLLLLSWPRANGAFLFGNTDMWAMAGVAAGLRWGWPAVFLLIKPTFAPFALVGIRHRSWWLVLAGMAVFGLLTLPLWLDYLTAMTNIRVPSDYSLGSIPLLLVPVVAWVTRLRSRTGT
jgi:hypothetical protein